MPRSFRHGIRRIRSQHSRHCRCLPEKLQCVELNPLMIPDNISKVMKLLTFNELLRCRAVCRDWKEVIESERLLEQADGSEWTALFRDNEKGDIETFRKIKGTRFSSRREIASFLSQMRRSGKTGNPFPNRTVILEPGQGHLFDCIRLNFFYQSVSLLTESEYAGEIWSCALSIIPKGQNGKVDSSHLAKIFRFSNLRSLTIYCQDWLEVEFHDVREMKKSGQLPFLPHLREVKVFGESGMMPLTSLFFNTNYKEQIQRLYYTDDKYSNGVTCLPWIYIFPLVEQWKLVDPKWADPEVKLSFRWRQDDVTMQLRIKEVSIVCNESLHPDLIMMVMDELATTLESLYLYLMSSPISDSEDNNVKKIKKPDSKVRLNEDIKYPKIKILGLSQRFITEYPQILLALGKKFINLECLVFLDCDLLKGDSADVHKRFQEFCVPLWQSLPSTVKSISAQDSALISCRSNP